MHRFIAVLKARNLEFVRDKAALGWNILLPVLMIFGFAALFNIDQPDVYKVGVLDMDKASAKQTPFLKLSHINFINMQDKAASLKKVSHHKIDMLLEFDEKQTRYWINPASSNGYFLEQLLLGSQQQDQQLSLTRQTVDGEELRYVDWVLPGILAVNMMFSCLWGIGYVIVRYRKNQVLKRLKVTPLGVFEFLCAQVLSRLAIIVVITALIYTGCDLFVDFVMRGSLFDLFVVYTLGAFSLICMGLLVAARIRSEELSDGLLNIISWPMMLLSGAWFSMEGASAGAQWLSQLFPLTHLIDAARSIMFDGANLTSVLPQLLTLIAMSILFLIISTQLFRWE